MDSRHPTSSSVRTSRSSIRHRSGAYSPNPNYSSISHSRGQTHSSLSRHTDYAEHSLTVQVEDVDAVDSEPTILLVPPSRYSPSTPYLSSVAPRGSSHLAVRPHSPHIERERLGTDFTQEGGDNDSPVPFSPVPLTPRPAQPPRGPSACSVETTRTTTSRIPRLPTPDFTTRGGDIARSFLPQLFSFWGGHATARQGDAAARPPSLRTESDFSAASDDSTAVSTSSWCESDKHKNPTGNSRPVLLPSLSTSDKFTHKFPRPRSVRTLTLPSSRAGPKSAFAATMLEEGEGLGMERIDRWTLHKWCLLLSLCTVFVYGSAGLACAIMTWFRTWAQADVMYVADNDVLTLITLASIILLLTFLVGISGTILNSRPILAVYGILLWPALISILAIGYTAYKRYAFALDRKLNFAWSQWYTDLGRLVIQDSLRCCGYYDALHEATPSARCYPRTPLPGCKGKLYRFEHENLATVWSAAFALVPVHLVNILVSLLCANHVTCTFGKGITPRKYWLSGADVKADAQRIMDTFSAVRPVTRPGLARAAFSGVLREDKVDSLPC
ncbi:hypothetical protein AcV7_005022 [Taiwanofungus camphoratus]|nr:hypothetical protein AcV7_005022 [Antrodia cinnamomea]